MEIDYEKVNYQVINGIINKERWRKINLRHHYKYPEQQFLENKMLKILQKTMSKIPTLRSPRELKQAFGAKLTS